MIIHPPHTFSENSIQHALPATPSANPGIQITASGSVNVKGSWTTLIDPLNYDVYRLWIGLFDCFTSATIERMLVDIGYGDTGGGNEQVLLPNLLGGGACTTGFAAGQLAKVIDVPMFIPAGKSLRARCQSAIASNTIRVAAHVWGGPNAPPWRVFTGCDDYGIDTSSSSGTSHTAGNTGAESSWASIGSTLSRDYDAFFLGQQPIQTVLNAINYHMEVGYSSTNLGEFFHSCQTNETAQGPWPPGPNYVPLPSGTQMQIRGEASGTAQAHEFGLYCLY